jgi:hypothetical protein
MKKAEDTRYQSSANLFQFCRRVLDHKFGGVRVIDQDVGQILNFDPADCSHWKKGKKHIRSVQAIKAIADKLGVDERLVVDVAMGEMDDDEAFWEYQGYGAFQLDPNILEPSRKEYFRKNTANWSKDKEIEWRNAVEISEAQIENIALALLTKLSFVEAPLYLPEISSGYPEIRFEPSEMSSFTNRGYPFSCTRDNGNWLIRYPKQYEGRAFTRFAMAKLIAARFLPELPQSIEFDPQATSHLIDVKSNLFASMLLVPSAALRMEMQKTSPNRDVVTQLAETFWVSKSIMNQRLRQMLQKR